MTLEEKEKAIINNYGLMEQLKYWFTEIAELTIAITKYQYGVGSKEEVVDEIGDVDMMLNQFRVALDILKKEEVQLLQNRFHLHQLLYMEYLLFLQGVMLSVFFHPK